MLWSAACLPLPASQVASLNIALSAAINGQLHPPGLQLQSHDLRQLWQADEHSRTVLHLPPESQLRTQLHSTLLQEMDAAWAGRGAACHAPVTQLQRQVHRQVLDMGLPAFLEASTRDGRLAVDIAVLMEPLHEVAVVQGPPGALTGDSCNQPVPVSDTVTQSFEAALASHSGLRVAIEVDGPTHFSRNRPAAGARPVCLGGTLLRNRLLEAAGWSVVQVPHFVWRELEGWPERQAWLADRFAQLDS